MAEILYPIVNIKYNDDNTLLSDIVTWDDIDKMFFNQFQINIGEDANHRIKYIQINSTEIPIPCVFYNENDRVKQIKQSPIITIEPIFNEEDTNHKYVGGYDQKSYDNSGHTDFHINNKPIWYTFKYKVTCLCTEWKMFRCLSKFLSDVMFPEVNGQRVIVVSINKPVSGFVNRRYIEIVEESKSEDFQNNYFQYDVVYEFDLPLYIQPWSDAYGVETLQIVNTISDEQVN